MITDLMRANKLPDMPVAEAGIPVGSAVVAAAMEGGRGSASDRRETPTLHSEPENLFPKPLPTLEEVQAVVRDALRGSGAAHLEEPLDFNIFNMDIHDVLDLERDVACKLKMESRTLMFMDSGWAVAEDLFLSLTGKI